RGGADDRRVAVPGAVGADAGQPGPGGRAVRGRRPAQAALRRPALPPLPPRPPARGAGNGRGRPEGLRVKGVRPSGRPRAAIMRPDVPVGLDLAMREGYVKRLDLRKDFADVYGFVSRRVRSFDPATNDGPGKGKRVSRIDIGFGLYHNDGWICLVFDT